MPLKTSKVSWTCVSLFTWMLSGCFSPPYNNFRPDHPVLRRAATGATVGAIAGGIGSESLTGAVVGAAAGSAIGALVGLHKESRKNLIDELQGFDIQYVQYGDTTTFIVPTDRYFIFDSVRLKDICYPGLNTLVKIIKLSRCPTIYVAGFTDNVGSRYHKKMLSQGQAEAMLTFLWAHDIPAQRLQAEGYEDKHPIGDNRLIHGSAYNRRLEVQLVHCSIPQAASVTYLGPMK